MPTVDIVVVTHNSRGYVDRCLDSIAESDFEGEIRAVVVDNASRDGSADAARAHRLNPQVIANPDNRGFAAACNQGIDTTSGDLVLLLNPDARLLPSTLRELVAYLADHPRVAIAGPRLLQDDGSLQVDISATGSFPGFVQALFEYTRLGRLLPAASAHRDYFLPEFDRLSNRAVAMVQGACLLFRRAVTHTIGLLDERFFLYFEETDFCKRASDRGWEVHYVGAAAAYHVGSHSHEARRPSAEHFIASMYRFHRKHYGALEAVALWAVLMPVHALRVVRLWARARLDGDDTERRDDLRTARERLRAHWTMLASGLRGWRDVWLHDLRLAEWRRIVGARPLQLAIPVALSAIVAALEGISMGLLVPMAVGVTKQDFGFVRDMPVFSSVTERLPHWFGSGGDSFARLFLLVAAAAFLAAVLKNVLSYATFVLSSAWYGTYLQRANDHVFRRHLAFGKLYFDRVNQGALQTLFGYTGELIDFLALGQKAILNLLTLAAYLAVMLWISWRLTLFVLCFLPVTHFLVRRMARRIEHLSRQLNEATLTRHATAFNILSNIPLFKAYSQEEQAARTYSENNERLRRLNLRINAVQGLFGPVQEILALVVVLATIAFVAFCLSLRDPTELAVFLVFFFAVRNALPRFAAVYEARVALAAKKPRLTDLATLLDDEGKFIVHDGTFEIDAFRDSIEVRDLHFRYREDLDVLDGIDIRFRRGTITALVGPSGAGKSTLVHLLLGFYPIPPGSLFVDGRDLTTIKLGGFRDLTALVAQDVFVFNDTLRANIGIGAGRAVDDAEIWAVLEQARLAAFARSLPEGLDTHLGDHGVKLSGGERQRVAICRALLRRPAILILDEATSALDTETERLIQEAIDELMKNRTSIVIAHRLSTIRNADHIVVLEEGRVAEQGTLDELLSRNGRFAELWSSQDINHR